MEFIDSIFKAMTGMEPDMLNYGKVLVNAGFALFFIGGILRLVDKYILMPNMSEEERSEILSRYGRPEESQH